MGLNTVGYLCLSGRREFAVGSVSRSHTGVVGEGAGGGSNSPRDEYYITR